MCEKIQTVAGKLPKYWKCTLEDAEKAVGGIKKGTVEEFLSAGGRKIYRVFYGKKNEWQRTANYSSAAGSRDIACYAKKDTPNYRPTLFLVGGIHGFEFEGSVALLNLISLIESGEDYAGNPHPILKMLNNINLIIIPYANPDGRERVPLATAVGVTLEEFRYYAQGTWADGSLCDWPKCKTVHPMRGERAGHLGAYYNDDGINLMHDLFPFPVAEETKILFDTVDEYVPDMTVLLHGGASSETTILPPAAVHFSYIEETEKFSRQLAKRLECEGLHMDVCEAAQVIADTGIPNYNLASALTNTCGEVCITYETNQGLDFEGTRLTLDEIYVHHMLLFEELGRFVSEKNKNAQ